MAEPEGFNLCAQVLVNLVRRLFARAGGQPIAQFIHPEDEEGRGWGFYVGIGCLVMAFLCTGCAGLAGALKLAGVY